MLFRILFFDLEVQKPAGVEMGASPDLGDYYCSLSLSENVEARTEGIQLLEPAEDLLHEFIAWACRFSVLRTPQIFCFFSGLIYMRLEEHDDVRKRGSCRVTLYDKRGDILSKYYSMEYIWNSINMLYDQIYKYIASEYPDGELSFEIKADLSLTESR